MRNIPELDTKTERRLWKHSQQTPRASLYTEVTARIIAELEAGRFPWVQPWDSSRTTAALPCNAVSGRSYSGVNVLILWGAVIAKSFPTQNWLTYKQTVEAGGCVRRGEQGTTIFYANQWVPDAGRQPDCEALDNGSNATDRDGQTGRSVPFLRRFTVFNVAQCEGLPEQLTTMAAPLPKCEILPAAEALIQATGADFRIGGNDAYYATREDYVQVPPQPAFHDPLDYYRTAFHELAHWSGHASRLNRNMTGHYGSRNYCREELVAELGSAFLCAALGISPTVHHAHYIAGWIDVLKADNRAIFRAAARASKAADYLLAFRPDAAGKVEGASPTG